MPAIIYDINTQRTYVSPIFAINRDEVIAFNFDSSGIKRIKRWLPYGVYIISGDDFDHQSKKWRGYEWVVGNKKLFRELKYGRTVSIEDFPEFKNYDGEIVLPEWFEVTKAEDITVLENIADLAAGELDYSSLDNSDLSIRVKTELGSYVNIRLIDVFEECHAESMDHLAGIGIERDENGFVFIYAEKQIKCRRIFWNVEVILPPYLRTHNCYPDISALYEDISLVVSNTELKDGRLIINADERIEAVLKNGEYVITVNGKREKDSVEDQDIYFYLLGLIFTPDRTKILWQFSRSRIVAILYDIMIFFIVAAPGLFVFAIGVITENAVLLVICPIVALIIFFAALIVMGVVHSRLTYKIRDSGLSGGKFEYLSFSTIENVELKPSRIFRNRATIKLTANGKEYYLRFITGADEAYKLIREGINNNH